MRMTGRFLAVLTIVLAMAAAALSFADAPRISKEDARVLLGSPNVVFLDARTGGSWSGSSQKIKGAVRVDPGSVGSWAKSYQKDAKLIVYCS